MTRTAGLAAAGLLPVVPSEELGELGIARRVSHAPPTVRTGEPGEPGGRDLAGAQIFFLSTRAARPASQVTGPIRISSLHRLSPARHLVFHSPGGVVNKRRPVVPNPVHRHEGGRR